MYVQVFVQAQRVVDVAEERIQAIEPSRRPKRPPCFKATRGLERQGLAMRDREQTFRTLLEQDPVKPFLECASTAANLLQGGPRVCLLGTSGPIARRRFADGSPRVSYRIVKEQSAALFAPVVSIGPLVRSCHAGIVNPSIIAPVPLSAPIPPRNRLAVFNSAKVFSGV